MPEKEHENWVVIRRGKLIYEAEDKEDADNNCLFEFEEVVCVTDTQLEKLKIEQNC